MHSRRRATTLVLLSILGGAGTLAAQPVGGETGPTLERDRVAAQGSQSSVLRVPRFGRYSVRVESPQGTALQLVDRMAGPGPLAGAAAERDGRLDVFLEEGEYLLVTQGHRAASGEARLEAHAFRDVTPGAAPRLEELKLVSASLRDLEERSWWLEIRETRRVELEAAGRALGDLRLWRDGLWLVDGEPETRVVQPRSGQPLQVCRLSLSLEPGLYRLAAYGGPELPWAEASEEYPFHLRWGIPRLGQAGRRRHEVSPFGVDRYRVAGGATYFRIELPEARPATLTVAPWDPERPFSEYGQSAAVEKESVPPVATLEREALDDAEHLVTVLGEAEQPYVLQHFQRLSRYEFRGDRPHWISTVHSGHAADSVDATGLLIEWPRDGRGLIEPLRTQVIEIDGSTAWRRRANLLDTLTLYVRIGATGRYAASVDGAEATVKFSPGLSMGQPAVAIPFRDSGASWDLDAGYYELTVSPRRKGIATLEIRPAGLLDQLLRYVGLGGEAEEPAVAGAVRFEEVALRRGTRYTLFVNRQPGVESGAVVRPLPLDLAEPLPLWQRPGEEVSVPFAQEEAGTLRAVTEEAEALEVSLDGGPWQRSAAVTPGDHTARVRVEGDATRVYSLEFEPARLAPDTPLPPLSEDALASLPDFPVLAVGTPRALDVERGGQATVVLATPEPGLYRLESTGLLATEGRLRTRTATSLVRRAANGVGRNFLIQSYLTPGDYQLTVAPTGESAGHLGLSLERAALARGGYLTLFRPARASLAAGEAIEYRFIITEPGEFRVRALGQGRALRCRLEDRDGWPVVPPEGPADVSRWFDPGHYRFVILPEATDARVVSVIEPVPRPRRYAGHGPHRLPLGQRIENVWTEPEGEGTERAPDVWELELPADGEVRLEVGGEMRGRLLRAGAAGEWSEAAELPARRGFRGTLERGRYRLELRAARIDNRAPYHVAAWPVPLLEGMERTVSLPAEVPVAVGETGLVELWSFGDRDVRARLYDDAGALVDASDDRPDDWNFHIGRSLDAGAYRLRVEPVGGARGNTTIAMRRPELREEEPLALPASFDLVTGDVAHVYPLVATPGGSLLLASARTEEGVGLALEVRAPDGWRTAAVSSGRRPRLEVPIDAAAEGRYRLRVWSLDRRDAPARLDVATAAMAATDASRLASGVALSPVAWEGPAAALASIRLERPGLLRVSGAGLRYCTAVDQPCVAAPEGWVAATGETLHVVGDETGSVRGERVALAPGSPPIAAPLPDSAPLLADVAANADGPLLLHAVARAGQPGVELLESRESSSPPARMAVGDGSAIAVALRGRDLRARAWRAAPGAAEAQLQLRAFSSPRGEPLVDGRAEGALAPQTARRLDLPRGMRLVRLALDASLVAVLSQGDDVTSVHWGAGGALAEALETPADRLTLLHAGDDGDAEARFAIEALPLGEAAPVALAPGAPLERLLDRGGWLRVDLAALPEGGRLHVRGARGAAILVDADGRVQRGTDLTLAPGRAGVLRLPHDPGMLLAWSTPGEGDGGPWPEQPETPAVPATPPASLPLTGERLALSVRLDGPSVLHLRTAAAVATQLAPAGRASQVAVFPEGASLDAFLPEGAAELTLRALGGASLQGRAELTASSVTPLDEGLGPEVLLAPGATRFFSFRVMEPGPVGIGVRASQDVVEATLWDEAGRRLGEGTAQMPTLEPGLYLLSLSAPPAASPVRARAALVGVIPPETSPPEEIVRSYLERFAVSSAAEEEGVDR